MQHERDPLMQHELGRQTQDERVRQIQLVQRAQKIRAEKARVQ
jgi:hypothetical protein